MSFNPIAVIFVFLSLVSDSFAQTVIVTNMASLSQDKVIKKQLVRSLEGFLKEKEGPAKNNHYILKEYLPETAVLLDELTGIEQSTKYNDKNFYKCHLTNVVKYVAANYAVQFSYLGIAEGDPALRASYM